MAYMYYNFYKYLKKNQLVNTIIKIITNNLQIIDSVQNF
jgi:hypothetical protein